MKYVIVVVFFLLVYSAKAQTITVDSIASLESKITESSGLLYINGKLFTHTDSGNEPAIYELDAYTGKVIRTTRLKNTKNKDWEDITKDEEYIYVGDFGNNQGARTDLKIQKFKIIDLLNSSLDTITADTISFHYSDQVDFTPSNFTTNFDAEAFVSMGDSLYIFTKNWGDFKTNIYSCPKEKGNYTLNKIGSANTLGMVTGATRNEELNLVVLCGYSFTGAFLVKLSNVNPNPFQNMQAERFTISPAGSIQVEGICYAENNKYFLSSEASQGAPALLHKIEDQQLTRIKSLNKKSFLFFPNPSSDLVEINSPSFQSLKILDQRGRIVFESKEKKVDISSLSKGFYTLQVVLTNDAISNSPLLKK